MNEGLEPPDVGLAAPEPPPPAPPQRVPVWGYTELFVFFGLALPALLLGGLLSLALLYALPASLKSKALELVAPMFLGYVLMFGALAVLLRVQHDAPFWRALGWTPFTLHPVWTIAAGMGTAIALGLVGKLIHLPTEKNLVLDSIDGPGAWVLMAVFGVFVGPLCEELAFRGFLQPVLVRSMGPALGILAAALPFGFLHYSEYGNSWRHALVLSASGAAFGWMRHATGSTRAATFMHAAYNALGFVVVALDRRYYGL